MEKDQELVSGAGREVRDEHAGSVWAWLRQTCPGHVQVDFEVKVVPRRVGFLISTRSGRNVAQGGLRGCDKVAGVRVQPRRPAA